MKYCKYCGIEGTSFHVCRCSSCGQEYPKIYMPMPSSCFACGKDPQWTYEKIEYLEP